MIKILRKSFRKRIAILLLAVMLIPLVPVVPVYADVTVPDFPYLSQSWYDTNTDSFALWEVHGSDNVSYVQTRTNVFSSGAFPVVYRSGLSWITYYYYIDYSKIIDTWDKDGNHIDGGYSWNANIRIPAPGETTVNSEVYATLVYCTTDIYYGNGAGDNDIYAYQNFIVSSYADPTPTPAPQPSYGELPTFTISASTDYLDECTLVVKCTTSGTLNGYTYTEGHYYASGASYQNNPWYYYYVKSPHSSYVLYGGVQPYFVNPNGNFDMIYTSGISAPRVFSIGYDAPDNIITSGIYIDNVAKCDLGINTSGYHCYANYFPIQGIDFWFDGSNNINIFDTARFELVACNYGSFRGYGDLIPSTPTPTVAPTAIPQPSISPIPTEPPDSGEDNNWTGLFGWLKRIRDSILNIPKKIASGIFDALKYIFLPDPDKVKGVFNTLNNKFGIQHPTSFTFDPNELFRPSNVVWQFRPISLNGEETEPVDVTIINFEEVDEWLDSSPGMVITRILQAMFGITMFAYLIYIFTKHIATINYTDAHTLMHLDDPPQNQKGGSR